MVSVLNCFILLSNQFGHLVDLKKKPLVSNILYEIQKHKGIQNNKRLYLSFSIAGAVTQPLPTSYLIFRAPSQAAGKCWLDALELSLRCSSLLVRSTSTLPRSPQHDATTTHETQWSEADYEKHFNEHLNGMRKYLLFHRK